MRDGGAARSWFASSPRSEYARWRIGFVRRKEDPVLETRGFNHIDLGTKDMEATEVAQTSRA